MKLELHTERVLLTPLAMTDLDIALELWTDPEVVEYICEVPTESEIRHEMPDAIKRGGNGVSESGALWIERPVKNLEVRTFCPCRSMKKTQTSVL
jgi:hypothetical protein